MRRNCLVLMLALAMVLAAWGPASAVMFTIGGKDANFTGYVSQSVQHSLESGDYYDVEEGFNQALMNVFLEGDVKLSSDWTFYAAGMLTVDWMYDLKKSDKSWNDKRFDKSSDTLHVDDEWWQLLKEAHITWNPGDFSLRIGKQIVKWGEMMAVPVNDVIMPTDNTHGLAEVELETLYIPIPLVNASYDTSVEAGPFQQMGIQFIFNPNADFIPSIYNVYGNDEAGIWAVDIVDDSFGFPVRIGRSDVDIIDDPDHFDSDYFEYGMKISAHTQSSIFSLMGFYGINNWASTALVPPFFTSDGAFDPDFNPVLNLTYEGYYAREKFVGASWSTELPISSSSLGGVRPLLDLEVSYRFDDVFLGNDPFTFAVVEEKTDTLVAGAGVMWKMKVPWQKAFLSFTANAVYTKYQDDDVMISDATIREDWWTCFFDMNTSYKKWDLMPGIWVYSEQNGDLVQIAPYILWAPSSTWSYYLTASFFEGSEVDAWGLGHKNFISLKATYQF